MLESKLNPEFLDKFSRLSASEQLGPLVAYIKEYFQYNPPHVYHLIDHRISLDIPTKAPKGASWFLDPPAVELLRVDRTEMELLVYNSFGEELVKMMKQLRDKVGEFILAGLETTMMGTISPADLITYLKGLDPTKTRFLFPSTMEDIEKEVLKGPFLLPGIATQYEHNLYHAGTVWVAEEPFGAVFQTSPYGIRIDLGSAGKVYTMYTKLTGYRHGKIKEFYVRR